METLPLPVFNIAYKGLISLSVYVKTSPVSRVPMHFRLVQTKSGEKNVHILFNLLELYRTEKKL